MIVAAIAIECRYYYLYLVECLHDNAGKLIYSLSKPTAAATHYFRVVAAHCQFLPLKGLEFLFHHNFSRCSAGVGDTNDLDYFILQSLLFDILFLHH